jgi:hypothetical protein
MLYFL